jgi:hypothetical protein
MGSSSFFLFLNTVYAFLGFRFLGVFLPFSPATILNYKIRIKLIESAQIEFENLLGKTHRYDKFKGPVNTQMWYSGLIASSPALSSISRL